MKEKYLCPQIIWMISLNVTHLDKTYGNLLWQKMNWGWGAGGKKITHPTRLHQKQGFLRMPLQRSLHPRWIIPHLSKQLMLQIKTSKIVMLLSFGFKGNRRNSLDPKCDYGSRIWNTKFFHRADSELIERGLPNLHFFVWEREQSFLHSIVQNAVSIKLSESGPSVVWGACSFWWMLTKLQMWARSIPLTPFSAYQGRGVYTLEVGCVANAVSAPPMSLRPYHLFVLWMTLTSDYLHLWASKLSPEPLKTTVPACAGKSAGRSHQLVTKGNWRVNTSALSSP